MRCPACQSTLETQTWHGIKVDICVSRCQGIWCDWMELDALAEDKEIEDFLQQYLPPPTLPFTPAREIHRYCPRDNTLLVRYVVSPQCALAIDICPQCKGSWLDQGELKVYADYLATLPKNPWGKRTQLFPAETSTPATTESISSLAVSSLGEPSLLHQLKLFIPKVPL